MNYEAVALAGILHNPVMRHRVRELSPESFTGAYRALFGKCVELGHLLSPNVLAAAVYHLPADKLVLVKRQLDEILEMRPTRGDWSYAIGQLLANARWRKIDCTVRSAYELAQADNRLAAEALIQALPAELRRLSGQGCTKLQDARAEARHVHDSSYSGPRMMTGISRLDALTGGCRRGQLVLWGGLAHQGKTTFAVYAADAFVCQGLNVFFATLEMSSQQIEALLLAVHAHRVVQGGIPYAWLDDSRAYNKLTLPDKDKVTRVITHFSDCEKMGRIVVWHPDIDDTVRDVFDRVEEWASEIGAPVDAVFLDYLEVMPPVTRGLRVQDGLRENLTLTQRYTLSSQDGQGVLFWSPWQIKRDAEKDVKKHGFYHMSDFAESSYAERAADLMGWNLFDASIEDAQTMKMGVCKNRTTRRLDEKGWSLHVDADTCLFHDLDADASAAEADAGLT